MTFNPPPPPDLAKSRLLPALGLAALVIAALSLFAVTAAGSASAKDPGPDIIVYVTGGMDAAEQGRYDEATTRLDNAGWTYVSRTATRADIDALANVSNSVIPRFFLGDPTATGWVSQTKVNNGGLRWLKGVVPETAPSDPPAEDPPVSSADVLIYVQASLSSAEQSRLDEAKTLLDGAGLSYETRTATRAEIDALASVSNSVIPRFFHGDPTAAGWVSQTGTNNGGLRWLEKLVEAEPELQQSETVFQSSDGVLIESEQRPAPGPPFEISLSTHDTPLDSLSGESHAGALTLSPAFDADRHGFDNPYAATVSWNHSGVRLRASSQGNVTFHYSSGEGGNRSFRPIRESQFHAGYHTAFFNRGSDAMQVAVRVGSLPDARHYVIDITRGTRPKLTGLTVSGGNARLVAAGGGGGFSPDKGSYVLYADPGATVTVSATGETGSAVTVHKYLPASSVTAPGLSGRQRLEARIGDEYSGGEVVLKGGTNIAVKVTSTAATAADGARYYVIFESRTTYGTGTPDTTPVGTAKLTGLTSPDFTLNFDPDVRSYTVNVPASTIGVRLTGTAESGFTVKYILVRPAVGDEVDLGGGQTNLFAPGETTKVKVQVLSGGVVRGTYTINIVRAAS